MTTCVFVDDNPLQTTDSRHIVIQPKDIHHVFTTTAPALLWSTNQSKIRNFNMSDRPRSCRRSTFSSSTRTPNQEAFDAPLIQRSQTVTAVSRTCNVVLRSFLTISSCYAAQQSQQNYTQRSQRDEEEHSPSAVVSPIPTTRNLLLQNPA